MFKTKREKTLATILGGAFAVVASWQLMGTILLGPIVSLQQSIRAAASDHMALNQEMLVVDRANAEIGEFYRRSLPPDPADASVTYQNWLLERLKSAGISTAVVTPGPASEVEDVGHRIPFSVSATTELKRIGAFLDQIESTDILHRVTHMNVTTSGNAASRVRNLTLGLEAIALNDADTGRPLPAPSSLNSSDGLLAAFSNRDLFQRFVPKPPPKQVAGSKSAAARKPVVPPRRPKSVRFVASVLAGERRQAWFVDPKSKSATVLTNSGHLDIGDSHLEVIVIDSDSVRIRLDGTELTLTLGDTVRESISIAMD